MNTTNTVTLELHEYNTMRDFIDSIKNNGMAVERSMGYVVREYYGENEALKKLKTELEMSLSLEDAMEKDLKEQIKDNEILRAELKHIMVKLSLCLILGACIGVLIIHLLN